MKRNYLYKRELDNVLKNRLPRAFFLYGECDFLIDYYGKKIRSLIKSRREVEEYIYYFDEYNANDVKNALSEQSLFCSSSLVALKLNKAIKITKSQKSKKNEKKNDISEFLEILAKNTMNHLIIEYYNDNDRNYGKNAAAISEFFNGDDFISVRFFNPDKKEILEILESHARELNITISQNNLLYLCSMQNNNISLCINELKKLSLLEGEITHAHINEFSYGLQANTIEELCWALFDNQNACIKIIANLELEGVDMMDIIAEVQRFFYRLFLFFSYIKSHARHDSSEILGYKLPPLLEKRYAQCAVRLKEWQYLEIFTILSTWRTLVISGKEKNYFIHLIKIQAMIK